jgi:hypothetical protein
MKNGAPRWAVRRRGAEVAAEASGARRPRLDATYWKSALSVSEIRRGAPR